MDHLQDFRPRKVIPLSTISTHGWRLKRYAILADGRELASNVISAAADEAILRLPKAGTLLDDKGNHGVGFQLVHFAQVAVVSPVFFWRWGSVLANISQMRADWETPTEFEDGVKDIIGCVWEMEVVSFEINAWKKALLNDAGTPAERLSDYLSDHLT